MQSLVGSTKSRMKIRFVSTQHPPDICGNHGECTTATPASHCSREGAITTQPERPQSTKGKTSNKMVSSQRGIFQFLRSSASKAPQSRGGVKEESGGTHSTASASSTCSHQLSIMQSHGGFFLCVMSFSAKNSSVLPPGGKFCFRIPSLLSQNTTSRGSLTDLLLFSGQQNSLSELMKAHTQHCS